jgi:hypothetical protein
MLAVAPSWNIHIGNEVTFLFPRQVGRWGAKRKQMNEMHTGLR